MKKTTFVRPHIVDFLFSLALFCVFAVCAFSVIIIGAGVYRRIAQNMEDTASAGTAFAYVTEKLRQHDREGGIAVSDVEGRTALLLTDTVNGAEYETWIYSSGDALCEAVVKEGTAFSPSPEDEILKIRDFTITLREDGFLELSARNGQGAETSCLLRPHTGVSG